MASSVVCTASTRCTGKTGKTRLLMTPRYINRGRYDLLQLHRKAVICYREGQAGPDSLSNSASCQEVSISQLCKEIASWLAKTNWTAMLDTVRHSVQEASVGIVLA